MKDCVSCVHEYLSPMSDTCRECGIAMLNYEEAKPKPITNADRIRSMSDEELADFITDNMCGLICGDPLACEGQCKQKMLDWLKEEEKG